MNWLKNLFGIYPSFGGIERSNKWGSVRKLHLSVQPLCQVCGTKGSLLKPNEVHHIIPFHIDKSLELRESNLITFCRVHHLLIGHLMSWSSYNEEAKLDALIWRERIAQRP